MAVPLFRVADGVAQSGGSRMQKEQNIFGKPHTLPEPEPGMVHYVLF